MSPLPDLITFAITGTGPFVINLSSPLIIQHPVILDAATQPGYLGTPVVVLAGGNKISDGLVLASPGGTTIEGLGIVGFTQAGIDIESGGNLVEGNDIGGAAGGNGIGVLIDASDNTIGGTTGGAANVIADNTQEPVKVASGNGNSIRGNPMYSNGTGAHGRLGHRPGPGRQRRAVAPMNLSATNDGGQISVSGSLGVETTSGTFLLDFYTYQPGGGPAGLFHDLFGHGHRGRTDAVLVHGPRVPVRRPEHHRDGHGAGRQHFDLLGCGPGQPATVSTTSRIRTSRAMDLSRPLSPRSSPTRSRSRSYPMSSRSPSMRVTLSMGFM